MPIRSLLDTSVYRRNPPQGRIGNLVGLLNGIGSIYSKAKAAKRTDNEIEQNEYLNTVLGQHLAGWSGDIGDFNQRTQSAMEKILNHDNRLYTKAADMISRARKQVYSKEQARIANERGRLRNEAARRYLGERNRTPQIQPYEPAPYATPPRNVRQWNI